ncbi:MAG: tRNA uridine-5-carboxymethylaminomethyl(34) synthesis GTPase MnmE [Solobacterium sp.]|nr:tRNA uridine-5-carboxymethylaminomethyl(34) synthesis GTPase MnmE [Solobacterium sp.]MBQ6356720.1 tRNA uridine-5-carboxymethylaminomethyl(34) synthesis GTPase MnmE [Solobacterium sp.]MBQ6533454.1 tRNA uridine-5-carboxymethylaminomethyl(34) synthesis GTPase MnmE [Solobacterium sp.]
MAADTIVAISTALGVGAISIIRLSGDEALPIVSRLTGKDLTKAEGYTIHYGTIKENDEPVDEVLISVFHGPRSYTGEDMAEINCHGGIFVTRKVLSLCIAAGARLARRGEFTERAFLNGRMDLAQAEGVNDLIFAQDRVNARSAMHSLKGSVTKLIDPLVDEIVQILAHIEVNIDYPEYEDVHQLTDEEILPAAYKWLEEIDTIIEKAQQAVLIRSGIDTVILGKPNVGKSSLLNALLEEDKAIVTDIAGTTRDLVEGSVRLGNVTLNLIDTAGIHEAGDKIEKMGIERSLQALEKAELVLLVLDSSSGVTAEDQRLLDLTEGRNRIILYNKKDQVELPDTIAISAKEKDLDALVKAIEEKYDSEIHAANEDTLNNERQIGLAIQAKNAMQDVIRSLEAGLELDLVTLDLQAAHNALKEITGEATREGLLDEIFSRFCLGK